MDAHHKSAINMANICAMAITLVIEKVGYPIVPVTLKVLK